MFKAGGPLFSMKYILVVLALVIAGNVNAQSDLAHTPMGALYKIYTPNTGDKIKMGEIVTFNFIEKTDKDSVLRSTYLNNVPVQAQIQPVKNIADLMEIFPLLVSGDSALVKIPTDTIFKGHDEMRPRFFPKGSFLNIVLRILKVQTLDEAISERNAMIEKVKSTEATNRAKYIADHKLVLKTTASGLQYVITKPSLKPKPQKGDTVFVNYVGRNLDDKVFDTSLADVAKSEGTFIDGRPYEPLQFSVGQQRVIAGWDEGLLLLNEGAKATFVIPSGLAYGEHGNGDEIKPYSTLVFDVELVKIKPIKHPVPAIVKKAIPHKKIVKKKQ